MKRYCIILATALAFSSCSGNLPEDAVGLRITVGTDDQDSRTSLGPRSPEGKYPCYWASGDVISINGAISRPVPESAVGRKSAEFSFDTRPATASAYNVIYPGTSSVDEITFPLQQYYVKDSFCPGALPLFARVSNLEESVLLRTPAAIVAFPISGSALLSSMEISSLAGEKLGGTFNLGADSALTPSPQASESISYSFGAGLALSADAERIYFTVPAGHYENGLRAVLSADGGAVMTLRFFASGADLAPASLCLFPQIAFQAGKEIVFSSSDPLQPEIIEVEQKGGNDDMGSSDAERSASITACTYNIWAPSARKSVMDADETVSEQRSWANSYESVAAMINYLDCDVVGIQEVTSMVYNTSITSPAPDYDGVVHTLNTKIPSYSWVIYNASNTTYDSLFPNNTTRNGLGSTDAILYKSSVLTLVSHGRYWLNGSRRKAPQDDSSWDRIGTNRPATWAKFTHKPSGKQFVFITTHLDLPNAGNEDDPGMPQRRNATELIEWFAPLVTEGLPSVITGDMNVDSGDNYRILTSGRWSDVYDEMLAAGTLSFTDVRSRGTMQANKNEEGGVGSWRPDHILIDGFTPSYYKVGRERFPTKDGSLHYPSDHLPIKVILNF